MDSSRSLHEMFAEVQKRVRVLGFRSVSVSDPRRVMKSLEAASKNGSFQLMNADLIAGPKHVQFAAINAFKAFEDGYNVSRALPTEILRYASIRRQIKDAIKILGISESTPRIVAVLIDFTSKDAERFAYRIRRTCGGISDSNVIELSSKSKLNRLIRLHGITDQEIHARMHFAPTKSEAVINAIIEKMAILSIGK